MINLSRPDATFMLSILILDVDLKAMLLAVESGYKVTLDDDIADQLRDLCGERLQTHGFDKNYHPTEEGQKLERLIDNLFVG